MRESPLRRGWKCFFVVFLLASGLGSGQDEAELRAKLEKLQAYPDLIVFNGKIATIATMDTQLTQVEAMAIRDSRIIALGTNQEMRSLSGPDAQMLDVKGRRVLPGLIDGHTHPHLWAVEHWLGAEGEDTARRYNDPQLKIVYAKGDTQTELLLSLERVIRQRAREMGPGKWIWVTLWANADDVATSGDVTERMMSPGGPVTTELLDRIAPDNPVMVHEGEAIGPSLNNTRAKEEMERILGREVTGLNARTGVLWDILLRGRLEEAADLMKRELETCVAAKGVTTYGNHYYGTPTIMKITNMLYQRGELPVRWAWWWGTLWGNDPSAEDLPTIYRNLGDFQGIGNDYIWNAGVSNEAWETGVACTTAKRLPGAPADLWDRPPCSEVNWEQSGGYRNVQAALEAGLRIGFLHGYSDGTYDAAFKIIEDALASGKVTLEKIRASRISFEHNPIIRPDQAQRMAHYGMMPAFNGYQVQATGKGGDFLKAYGEQYMKWIAPVKTLVDAGVHVVFNTDAHLTKVPVESKDMEYPNQWDGSIWGFIQFFLTRQMPDTKIYYNEEEALDRVTLMKAATIWGAEQLLREDHIGSLEVGKLADFIVIDKDYFEIPAQEVGTIETLMTVVGGKTVYRSPGF